MCMLHCLGLPLLLASLPMIGQLGDDHFIHVALLLVTAPITLWVVWRADVGGKGKWFISMALVGLATMIVAVSVEPLHDYEVPLTLAGGSLLGGAHLWRWFQRYPTPVDAEL